MKIKILFLSILFSCSIGLLSAQTDGGPPMPPTCNDETTNRELGGTGAPIGEGTYLIVGFALLYGYLHFRKISNKNEEPKTE